MHCEFTYTTNAFQDESWDLSNFICYEGSRIIINNNFILLHLHLILKSINSSKFSCFHFTFLNLPFISFKSFDLFILRYALPLCSIKVIICYSYTWNHQIIFENIWKFKQYLNWETLIHYEYFAGACWLLFPRNSEKHYHSVNYIAKLNKQLLTQVCYPVSSDYLFLKFPRQVHSSSQFKVMKIDQILCQKTWYLREAPNYYLLCFKRQKSCELLNSKLLINHDPSMISAKK